MVGLANHTVLISNSGKEYPIYYSASQIRDEEGNITGVVLVFHDITESRQAEEKIKASLKEKEVLLQESC
ncbi:MAG: PAS domain S-box protein [Bacteroidetes bacterium]|nr:PAS domain S-box protein [Bacteroidota bacterium]